MHTIRSRLATDFNQQRVLLLQGPMGPFFRYFADWLVKHDAQVWKINFNGGDAFFYSGVNVISFYHEREKWPDFLRQVLRHHKITSVFLYGDCRPYHRDAVAVCKELAIPFLVFEEGYIRPDYITLEQGGVNGFSNLPRDPDFYLALDKKPEPQRQPAKTSFFRMAWCAGLYYWASYFLRHRYRYYNHHKNFNPLGEGWPWLISGFRKLLYHGRDRLLTRRLRHSAGKRYFLVPLQTARDSQIAVHSPYDDIRDFIKEVLLSFAANAPKETFLIFKHHPMDRGYRNYKHYIHQLAVDNNVVKRVIYAHDLHLPTCLDHALGVVVINSTVGLSALLHNAPVKVLGQAFYDMRGLTCQKSIDRFWCDPGVIDDELQRKFRNYVIEHTQLNGSFYGRFPLSDID